MRVEHGAAGALREGTKPRIAHAPGVFSGDIGNASGASLIGGDAHANDELISAERAGIIAPAFADMRSYSANLCGAEKRCIAACWVAAAIGCATRGGVGAGLWRLRLLLQRPQLLQGV